MGNVQAASAPPPPISVLSPAVPKEQSVESQSAPSLQNPGTVGDLHKLCKDVQPMCFDGGRIMLQKALSSHFQVSHTINLGSPAQSGYRFGATYIGTPISPTEAYPVLYAEMEPNGNMNANILHQITPRLKCRVSTQIQKSKWAELHGIADYRGDSYTASLPVANPDYLNGFGNGIYVAHYLQNVSPNLALGCEVFHQRGYGIPGGSITVPSVLGRYTSGLSTISASVGLASSHFCFHQRASPQLQVGVELDINPRMQESVATVGYQFDIPKADFTYKGSVDSNGKVGAVLEKKLQPLPFTFMLSGMLDQPKNQFKIGCGLMIG